MAEAGGVQTTVDPRYVRLGLVFAFGYALVDVLIVVYGGGFVFFRFIGVVVAVFVIMDMVRLKEAGVEWGWTRYVVLVVVAIGGFLGFVIYAWRRYVHLENRAHSAGESATPGEEPEKTGSTSEDEEDAG